MGLELNNVSLSFDGKSIIEQLSFQASDGQIVCLLGPSGCGKTTTLRILAGLESPDHGSVSLNGRAVYDADTNMPPEKRRVGYLFQDYALFPHLSVRKNIHFGIGDKRNRDQIIHHMLQTVNMEDYADAMPHMLSGGQQQRVALARALATKPYVMLLDEPFSGLDTSLRVTLRDNTYNILKDNQVTTVMVTHDPDEAMFMADTIVLMDKGRIVQVGAPSELYSKPETEFCARFFGEVLSFTGIVQDGTVATTIGAFDVPGRKNGEAIQVLMRPESLQVVPFVEDTNNKTPWFELTVIHFLGDKKLLTLRHSDDLQNPIHVIRRVDMNDNLKEGDKVSVTAKQKDILLITAADAE